jgi:glycosyltransferase involved in cell wall biosynthesis
LIGFVVRMFTGTKWIADFRDPWVEMLAERSHHTRSALSDALEQRMEAAVMRRADMVLLTSERMRRAVAGRYPGLPDGKFVCLPNGIDLRQTVRREAPDRNTPLTITYAGTLYFERTPAPLFQAFGELVQEGKVKLAEFRIKLVGNCGYVDGEPTQEMARRFGIQDAVDLLDWLPRADAVRLMQQSHLLLVLAPPNHRLLLPAKLFDYVGSGTQVLAIADPGATTDFVRETGCGSCFAQGDIQGLKDYLHDLLMSGRYRDLRNDPDAFARYDARRLSGQLASMLSRQQLQTNQ